MSEVWPARLPAWGGGRGRAGRERGRPVRGRGSRVWGRGPPKETRSGKRRCRLATAEARGAPGPGPEAGVRGPRGGGRRGHCGARARVRDEPGAACPPRSPGGSGRGSGVAPPGWGTLGATFPPLVPKGVHALRSAAACGDPLSVFSQMEEEILGNWGGESFELGILRVQGGRLEGIGLKIVTVFLGLCQKWSVGLVKCGGGS